MFNYFINKFRFAVLQSAIKAFSDFEANHGNPEFIQTMDECKEQLRPYYDDYIRNISIPEMAASLELVAFVYAICKIKNCRKVLDLGSGLSSFVLRLYAQNNHNVTVFSVDDDLDWLRKSQYFVKKYGLSDSGFLMLDELYVSGESNFDLILHDLNFVEVRISEVLQVAKLIGPHGLLIFDDVHKLDYQFALLKKLSKLDMQIYSLKPETIDGYGRYAFAASR